MKNLNLLNIKNSIIDYIKQIKIINLGFVGLLILCGLLYGLYYNKREELKETQQNLIAKSDTIRIFKNKANENVYKIQSLTLDYKELKKVNSDLVNEINKLSKKDKNNLVEINKLNLTINLLNDSIKKINNKPIGSTYDPETGLTTYDFELKDSTKFRELRGIIKVTSKDKPFKVDTELLIDKVYTDLTIGKTLKNDKLELFVSSSNSKLLVTNLIGSVVDLKAYNKFQPKKRFSLSLQTGYGFTIYGLSPYIGIGGSYNLINF